MLQISRKILTTAASVALLLSLSFPNIILAKSGCCSGHGGVSCAAGAQSNGTVICNDGWRGSSCSYSGMVMCGGSSIQTTTVTTKTVAPVITSKPVYTSAPVKTLIPPIIATPKPTPTTTPTAVPTNVSIPTATSTPTTSSPIPTSSPNVQGASTQITPTSVPSPSPSSTPLTTSETLGVLAFLAIVIGLPIWGIIKLIKKLRKSSTRK